MSDAVSAELVLQTLRDTLRDQPGITAQGLMRDLEIKLSMVTQPSETSTCRHCDKPIGMFFAGTRWKHMNRDRSRRCRAASFVEGVGWDDRLSNEWRAEPAQE